MYDYNRAILKYPDEYKRVEVEKLGLDKLGVLIEDQSPISDYFNVKELPDEISNGKYSFIIDPLPNILKLGSQIKIELLDSNNNPIPILYPKSPETLTNYGAGNISFEENESSDGYSLNTFTGRNVQIVVYDSVPHGIATLSIVGEAKANIYSDRDIPKIWSGVYNIRWSKKILINKSQYSLNRSQILFYSNPTAEISEFTTTYKQLVGSASSYYIDTSSANMVSLDSSRTVVIREVYKGEEKTTKEIIEEMSPSKKDTYDVDIIPRKYSSADEYVESPSKYSKDEESASDIYYEKPPTIPDRYYEEPAPPSRYYEEPAPAPPSRYYEEPAPAPAPSTNYSSYEEPPPSGKESDDE